MANLFFTVYSSYLVSGLCIFSLPLLLLLESLLGGGGGGQAGNGALLPHPLPLLLLAESHDSGVEVLGQRLDAISEIQTVWKIGKELGFWTVL
jgi:hypothetical protein